MRDRRQKSRRGAAATVIGAGASVGFRLWARFARRPVDSLALVGAGGACLVIVVNALFLQSGSHPAPFFANPARTQAADTNTTSATTTAALAPSPASSLAPTSAAPRQAQVSAAAHPPAAARPQTPTARHDPIAELIGLSIGSPARVLAVQRALSEYGYGQIKVSGTLDQPTSAAIEKFEGEHKLPVTGRISDRLLIELGAMTGHPLQ